MRTNPEIAEHDSFTNFVAQRHEGTKKNRYLNSLRVFVASCDIKMDKLQLKLRMR